MKLFILLVLALCVPSFALAQQPPPDDIANRVIVDLFRRHNGKFLCLTQKSSLESVRASIEDGLKGIDLHVPASQNAIAILVYTAFPCPFSPARTELRLAGANDLEGNWIFPETSQKLRYGPQSPAWQRRPGMPPIRCEGVSYFAGGDERVMQAVGAFPCPTSKDLDDLRKTPKVSDWKLLRDGRLQTSRLDLPGHVEEWDVFVVAKPFEYASVNFATGDLLAYLRRDRNNPLNVATVFRHLQRLP